MRNKVLILTDSLENGGAERQMSLLAKYIPAGWSCRVWSLNQGPFEKILRENGIDVEVRERFWRWDITPAVSLWRIINQWKPDIIHSFGYMGTLMAVLPSKLFHIPLVDGTIRQANIPYRRGKVLKWALRWADRIITNSQAGLEVFEIDAKRGRVVRNGFDAARMSTKNFVKKEKEEPFTAIMVGRMQPVKDYTTYFNAMRLLEEKNIKCRFIAMGDGPQRQLFMKKNGDLIEKGLVIFPEPTLEVLGYVLNSHVGVLMTTDGHGEGISNAIMEYMACGLPVVCSKGGGNHEIVVHEQTGFIIEPEDPKILAEKLLWLMNHPDIAKKMGAAGRERIEREFTIEKMVNNTFSVYREVLPHSHQDNQKVSTTD